MHMQSYNAMHGLYTARMEQLFAHFWHWGLIRNFGVVVSMSCINQCTFCTNTFPLMFGRALEQPLANMMLGMRLIYLHCAAKSTLPQNVVNVI